METAQSPALASAPVRSWRAGTVAEGVQCANRARPFPASLGCTDQPVCVDDEPRFRARRRSLGRRSGRRRLPSRPVRIRSSGSMTGVLGPS